MHSRGIIYVATNDDRYVEEAVLAAETVKNRCPDLSVTLFTDRPRNPLTGSGYFDFVKPVPRGTAMDWGAGLLSRVACLAQSPYTETLHLDTDTRVLSADLPQLFAALANCDVGMVEDSATYSFARLHSGRRQFNGGLILYRNSERVRHCWREWEDRFRRNLALCSDNPGRPVPGIEHVENQEIRRKLLRTDQIALMEILSPERNALGLRLASLNDAWNFRGSPAIAGTKIHHSAEYKHNTRGEILALAYAAERGCEADRAKRLYDYVAEKFLEEHPPRRGAWWKRRSPEEWPDKTLRNADLHMQYDQTDKAIELFDRALEANGGNPYAIAGHARLGLRLGQYAPALGLAEEVARRLPHSAYAGTIYGAALLAAGRASEAIKPLQGAAKESAAGAFQLGQAFFQTYNYDQAVEAYLQALAIEPKHTAAANNIVPALLGAKRYDDAIARADCVLAEQPWHAAALAFKAVALAELDRHNDEQALVDLDRLIKVETLTAPEGRELPELNVEIAQHLAHEPSLRHDPPEHATRGGRHSGNLAQAAPPQIHALNLQILAAVDRRRAEIDPTNTHPFDRACPQAYRFISWTVIMNEGRHQIPHIHAKGWLSGVYYVEVPDSVHEDDPERSGWITFGPAEDRWRQLHTQPLERSVCPRPGMLITFPSFFWHGTRPLRSNARRISYAFDIIPL
jgi:tetratricopeptide (TPR) repeat protein